MKTVIKTNMSTSLERVFQVLSDPQNYKQAVPEVKSVEVVSDIKAGVGTRFIEVREYGGKDVSHEMVIKDYLPFSRLRIVSDSGGTIWDSLFELVENEVDGILLTLTIIAETKSLSSRIMNWLMKSFIKKAVLKDMEAVKTYCEHNT